MAGGWLAGGLDIDDQLEKIGRTVYTEALRLALPAEASLCRGRN